MAARVVVFLDFQNVYRRARATFCSRTDPAYAGQVDPLKLGELIVRRDADRELLEVRVYRGRPVSTKDPRTYAAHMRQCAAHASRGSGRVSVITRSLRYPGSWPSTPAEEKGIDVALAVDFVMMAVRNEYDVGVIMSTDTDLKPALEAVHTLNGSQYPRCEVAAWQRFAHKSRRLSVPGGGIWRHWLHEADFASVADPTDYNVAR